MRSSMPAKRFYQPLHWCRKMAVAGRGASADIQSNPRQRRVEASVSHRNTWISVLIAIPGVCACVVALVGFFRKIISNGLPYRKGLSPSEHYRAVGEAYGSGFLTGFFLCFFLVLAVLAVGAMQARRQRPRLVRGKSEPAHPVAFPSSTA